MRSHAVVAGLIWGSVLLSWNCGVPPAPKEKPAGEILTLEVAAHTVECVGEAVQRCLLVREGPEEEFRYFYDPVEGFDYQEGYRYRIRVLRRRVPDPPADASAFEYRLLEVLSKERAGDESPG